MRERRKDLAQDPVLQTGKRSLELGQRVLEICRRLDGVVAHDHTVVMSLLLQGVGVLCRHVQDSRHIGRRLAKKIAGRCGSLGSLFHALESLDDLRQLLFLAESVQVFNGKTDGVQLLGGRG